MCSRVISPILICIRVARVTCCSIAMPYIPLTFTIKPCRPTCIRTVPIMVWRAKSAKVLIGNTCCFPYPANRVGTIVTCCSKPPSFPSVCSMAAPEPPSLYVPWLGFLCLARRNFLTASSNAAMRSVRLRPPTYIIVMPCEPASFSVRGS